MTSLFGIRSNITNKRSKRSQIQLSISIHIANMTSKDLKRPQTNQLRIKKNKMKVCANIEINDKYLDEAFHNNTF